MIFQLVSILSVPQSHGLTDGQISTWITVCVNAILFFQWGTRMQAECLLMAQNGKHRGET